MKWLKIGSSGVCHNGDGPSGSIIMGNFCNGLINCFRITRGSV
jgi:hypothetical protein